MRHVLGMSADATGVPRRPCTENGALTRPARRMASVEMADVVALDFETRAVLRAEASLTEALWGYSVSSWYNRYAT